jgi:hypothetical protein
MIRKAAILFIEVEDYRDENIHTFEIVNFPENSVLRQQKISEVLRMTTSCFLEHEIPF